MEFAILKLNPFYSEKIWGWENWNLSCHPNGLSTVQEAISKKRLILSKFSQSLHHKTLKEILSFHFEQKSLADDFPILIKIIQAYQPLSIQVHPNDLYAHQHENSPGKSECWYILEADPQASILINFKNRISPQSLRDLIDNNKLEDEINRLPVKRGDFIYIPAGTVHAIGAGIRLLEIQQSSDITYRVYDYGRDREIHINQSLQVVDYNRSNQYEIIDNLTSFKCPYFNIERITLQPQSTSKIKVKGGKFGSITTTQGSVKIYPEHSKTLKNGKEIELLQEETCYLSPHIFTVENRTDQVAEAIKVIV